jgi:Uma2 family endonuclease
MASASAAIASKVVIPQPIATFADLLRQLGDLSPERVLMWPPPGTATEDDLVCLLNAANKRLCELVDGVLVEKAMGFKEGILAGLIIHLIWNYLEEHDLGIPAGADSPIRLRLGLVRLPDVCFISWDRIPGEEMPEEAISKIIPNLAIEVLSKSNTPAEIERKRQEYFKAGVELVWIIDPKAQSAVVWTSRTKKRLLGKDGILDGGTVLPEFNLSLKDLFARARRRQRRK